MMVRLGLLSVILSLLWFSPYAVTTSADGYQLEQATIDTNVVSERQLLDEPEQAIPPSLHLFNSSAQSTAEFIAIVVAVAARFANHQPRAPPQ